MKKVELHEGIFSSILGFGCASILGSVNAIDSKNALINAVANGINHFDLAPSYGYGEAEKFVGKFLKGQRHNMVLVSKFGIQSNWKSKALNYVKPLVRTLKSKKPKHQAPIGIKLKSENNFASHFLKRIPIHGLQMQKSLEGSLRSLKTDYLDFYFIHEPISSIPHFDELRSMAEDLKKQGKFRAWGIAFYLSQEHYHQTYIHNFDLLQFNSPTSLISYNSCVERFGLKSNIIFSPFNGENELSPKSKLEKLYKDFPNSVVLCSMFNEQHLSDNVAVALESSK